MLTAIKSRFSSNFPPEYNSGCCFCLRTLRYWHVICTCHFYNRIFFKKCHCRIFQTSDKFFSLLKCIRRKCWRINISFSSLRKLQFYMSLKTLFFTKSVYYTYHYARVSIYVVGVIGGGERKRKWKKNIDFKFCVIK